MTAKKALLFALLFGIDLVRASASYAGAGPFLFPNPMTRGKTDSPELHIWGIESGAQISVLDMEGKEIHSLKTAQGENQISWNLTDKMGQRVSPGVYALKIQNSQGHKRTHFFLNEIDENPIVITSRYFGPGEYIIDTQTTDGRVEGNAPKPIKLIILQSDAVTSGLIGESGGQLRADFSLADLSGVELSIPSGAMVGDPKLVIIGKTPKPLPMSGGVIPFGPTLEVRVEENKPLLNQATLRLLFSKVELSKFGPNPNVKLFTLSIKKLGWDEVPGSFFDANGGYVESNVIYSGLYRLGIIK